MASCEAVRTTTVKLSIDRSRRKTTSVTTHNRSTAMCALLTLAAAVATASPDFSTRTDGLPTAVVTRRVSVFNSSMQDSPYRGCVGLFLTARRASSTPCTPTIERHVRTSHTPVRDYAHRAPPLSSPLPPMSLLELDLHRWNQRLTPLLPSNPLCVQVPNSVGGVEPRWDIACFCRR